MPAIKIKITLVTIKITLDAQLGECGGGIYIRFLGNQFFHVQLGCGRGSNTRVEMISNQALLFFANFKRITSLQVCGDSKCIFNQLAWKSMLQVTNMEQWKQRLTNVGSNFQYLSFFHIRKELNTQAYFLSKKTIVLEEGTLYFDEFIDSTLVDKGSIHCNQYIVICALDII